MYAYLLTINPHNGNETELRQFFYLLSQLFDFKTVNFVIAYHPYLHLHAVIITKNKLDYRKVHEHNRNGYQIHFRYLKTQSDINNAIIYVSDHLRKTDNASFINTNVINSSGDNMAGVEERVENLERRLDRLEGDIRRILDILNNQTESGKENQSVEPERYECNLGKINVRCQKSQKGIALLVKFANYVKPNKYGQYYVSLTPKELKALIVTLQNALESFGEENGEPSNSSNFSKKGYGKKTGYKRVKGGYLG